MAKKGHALTHPKVRVRSHGVGYSGKRRGAVISVTTWKAPKR